MRLVSRSLGWAGVLALSFAPSALAQFTVTLDYDGNTTAGPHDAYHGEMDVDDAEILDGLFGPGATSVIGQNVGGAGQAFLDEVSAEATNTEYDALHPSDDIWLQTAGPGYFDNAFVQFVFDTGLTAVDLPLVESVYIEVEGRQGDPATDDWYIYAWDFEQSAYLRLSQRWDYGVDEIQAETLFDGYVSMNGLTLADASDLFDPMTYEMVAIAVNQDTNDWLRIDTLHVTINVIPEPATGALLGLGLAGLALASRRRATR